MNVRHALRLLLLSWVAGTVVACSSPSVEDHLAQAADFKERSLIQEAIIEYRNAIQIDPRSGEARRLLAEAYLETRDLGGALREYVRAADLLPQDADTQVKAGGLLLLARQFEDAQTRARNALDIDPNNTEALILLGSAKAGLEDLDGAIARYQEAATLNPEEATAFEGLGVIQSARGELAEAEANFRKALEVEPESLSARFALANLMWSSGRQAEAEEELKAAHAIDPLNPQANRALGVFYLVSGRAPEAEPYFKAIADSDPSADASIALSDYYVMTSRIEDARDVLEDLAEDEDAWAPATTRLAALDALEGFRVQGSERLRDVLGRFPEDRPARLLLARLLLADDKRNEALAEATTIVEREPTSPLAADAYMLIGQVNTLLDRPEAAIEAYEEVLTRAPQPTGALLALVSLHLSSGAADRAMTYVQQAQAIQPDNPWVRSSLVRVLLATGETTRARTELASLQSEFPESPVVLSLTGAERMISGEAGAARASFERAAALNPTAIEPLTALVQLDLAAGRISDAVERIEAALTTANRTGNLLLLAASTHAAAGQLDRAADLAQQAVDLEPDRLRGYGLLAQIFVTQNRLSDAERQFQAMVQRDPTSVARNTMLGMIYDMRGKFEEAEQQYALTLALDSSAAVAANNLAYRYADADKNLDQALSLAQTAMQRLPNEPNVRDTLGWVYYRKGLTSSAIRELEMAVTDLNVPLTHYHLGMAYDQAGEIEKARASLRAALAFGTDFAEADDARQALARLGG